MKMLNSAINYISENKIMHRDFKPENILLAKKGLLNELKIVDLGLATYLTRLLIFFLNVFLIINY